MSQRFEKSHALRNEQDSIEKRMAEMEDEFQECQDRLSIVKAKIAEIETIVLDEEDQDLIPNRDAEPSGETEVGAEGSSLPSIARNIGSESRPGLSTYTGRAKPTIMKKDHVHPMKGKTYLCEDYPCVIRLEQGWAEIWCHVCGANSTRQGFIAGLHGLLLHVQARHKKAHPRMTLKELVGVCGMHYLEENDVVLICLWEKKVTRRYEGDMATNKQDDEEPLRRAGEENARPRSQLAETTAPCSGGLVDGVNDEDDEEQVFSTKIKEEPKTNSEYGNTDELQVGMPGENDRWERKRRRLHVLPGSDDDEDGDQN